ncbi:hypothetical protein J2T13_000239 [Paenibacillus sp. DS2015]|uniref:hypothetical protein n=1 Tax=Paenibacillus sp. DS2015 TaxID=3373917 RepID=UPI003D1D2EDA
MIERGLNVMPAKRKPPTLQQKKDEVNKKAVMWVGVSVFLLILVVVLLLILTN